MKLSASKRTWCSGGNQSKCVHRSYLRKKCLPCRRVITQSEKFSQFTDVRLAEVPPHGSKVYLCRSSGLDLGRLDERYRSRDRDLERAIAGCLSQQCWIPYSNSRSKVERASLIRVDRRRFGTSGLGSGVTLTWSCTLWQASSHQTPRRYFAEDRASTDTGFPEVRL